MEENKKEAISFFTKEELAEIEATLRTFIDSTTTCYAKGIEKIYNYPEWFEKLPLLRCLVEKQCEMLEVYRIVLGFMTFLQQHGLALYMRDLSREVFE